MRGYMGASGRVVTAPRRPYFRAIRGLGRLHPGDAVSQSFLPPLAPYPTTRLRRNRRDAWSRKLVAESVLTAGDLIWPVFVHDEKDRAPVEAMPGAFRLSISALLDAAGEAAELGIPTIAVFPAVDPALKCPEGQEALNPDNLVCRAVNALKQALP